LEQTRLVTLSHTAAVGENMDHSWYEVVDGDDIEQGYIFNACPIYIIPSKLKNPLSRKTGTKFRWETRDVIIMTQSCDLVIGQEKVSSVLLAEVLKRSQITGHLSTSKGLEEARRGNAPSTHMLQECTLPGFECEVCVVDLQRLHSLDLTFVRKRALRTGPRLRLLSPYREHLSQAIGRYFMRVGLPDNIPSFTK
jgi:hypothetical protein